MHLCTMLREICPKPRRFREKIDMKISNVQILPWINASSVAILNLIFGKSATVTLLTDTWVFSIFRYEQALTPWPNRNKWSREDFHCPVFFQSTYIITHPRQIGCGTNVHVRIFLGIVWRILPKVWISWPWHRILCPRMGRVRIATRPMWLTSFSPGTFSAQDMSGVSLWKKVACSMLDKCWYNCWVAKMLLIRHAPWAVVYSTKNLRLVQFLKETLT